MRNLKVYDKRMLQFMEYCMDTGLSGITSANDWCQRIGMVYSSNLSAVKKGERSFTAEQILAAGQLGVSMDYIYGFSDDMLRSRKGLTPMQMLKAAVRMVDSELNAVKAVPAKKTVRVKR